MLDKVLAVNLKGVLYGMKHTLSHFKAQGSGAIVNAASVGGIRAVPNLVAYVASKHAVAGMTKQAAIEYGEFGVRVNAVAPGAILTDMIKGSLIQIAGEDGWEEAGAEFVSVNPMKRFGQPEEVASLVAFLLSDDASFVNGTVVAIDGGQSQATDRQGLYGVLVTSETTSRSMISDRSVAACTKSGSSRPRRRPPARRWHPRPPRRRGPRGGRRPASSSRRRASSRWPPSPA